MVSLPVLAGTAERLAEAVGFEEKLRVLGSVLDGSYFLRLISVEGRFDAMFSVGGIPRGGLAIATVLSGVGLAVGAARRRTPPGTAALLLCGALLTGLLLLLPGAVRAHHLMNLYPFPHWIAALGLVELWRGWRPSETVSTGWLTTRRAVTAALLLVLLTANLRVVWRTHAEVQRSGGRGYWSDAIVEFVEEASSRPGTRVVALDWGLHNQVAFLGEELRSLDAIWHVRDALARGETWSFLGDAGTVYLIHPGPLDLVGLGVHFQSALEALPEDQVDVRPHLDREGGVAFLAVRLGGPHQVLWNGRRFSIRVKRAASR